MMSQTNVVRLNQAFGTSLEVLIVESCMKSQPLDALEKLVEMLNLPAEYEIVEFKHAKGDFHFDNLGKYFSALSNEANLKHQPTAWLIFGVTNNRQVVGTNYHADRPSLDRLKKGIADKTTNRITFVEIHEVAHENCRVIMFEIPAAPKGVPIAFNGHYYGRDGESLSPLNLEEIERIRVQATLEDWSKTIVPDVGLSDLDEEAIRVARKNFKDKFPKRLLK
jgi:ATP-dependent DNA helicase RecG